MNYKTVMLAILALSLTSCIETKQEKNKSILQKVNKLNGQLKEAVSGLSLIASLDHHRMAEEEGAYTPPAIASIYSNAKISTDILAKSDPLVGLDLPFKFLCYSEADTSKANLAYTSSSFIAKRHALSDETLSPFQTKLAATLKAFDNASISSTNLKAVKEGFGIVKIQSDFDFETTIDNLRAIVNAQADTRWFGEIDYKNEAKAFNVELNPNILLLFGGPAPGAKAMMTTPKIGLDAFCQKLLVYQNDNEEVWVAFNDIVAFSELYYGNSTKPQQMINQRLTMTFTKAVKMKTEK